MAGSHGGALKLEFGSYVAISLGTLQIKLYANVYSVNSVFLKPAFGVFVFTIALLDL